MQLWILENNNACHEENDRETMAAIRSPYRCYINTGKVYNGGANEMFCVYIRECKLTRVCTHNNVLFDVR